ncbi:uncharacterized protein ACJ7VT_001502 [Polymixia lowei]
MVDYIMSEPLRVVLIITAQMVFNGHSNAEKLIQTEGDNINLLFTFTDFNSTSVKSAGLYINEDKIKDCLVNASCDDCAFNKTDVSVSYCIKNVTLNNNGIYSVYLFMVNGDYLKHSDNKSLTVQKGNSNTVAPTADPATASTQGASGNSSPAWPVALLVVLLGSTVLLAAVFFSWFIWGLMKNTDQQQQDTTKAETVEASNTVPACSLVYSVLDFPRRPQEGAEASQPRGERRLSDTEYTAVTFTTQRV